MTYGTLSAAAVAFLLFLCLTASATLAAETPSEPAPRRIYVPFSDLHVLLQQQPKRVLLGREEYEELVRKAKKTPETHAPQPAAIVAAQYTATVADQRAEIHGVLTIDVLESGLHALPLDLGGVGVLRAVLDGRNASIGQDPAAGGRFQLFVEGLGRHELSIDLTAPLKTTAARQVLNLRLPHPAASQLHLTVPGDVEIKEGASVASRVVDAAAKLTRFELLPREGDMSIVMTLNSHLQRQQRAVVARSVLIDEVTQAYERLHATVSLAILYRAVDRFQFVVPDGFEITEVSSPLLARWDVQPDGSRRLLNIRLREQTTETVVLKIAAIRSSALLLLCDEPISPGDEPIAPGEESISSSPRPLGEGPGVRAAETSDPSRPTSPVPSPPSNPQSPIPNPSPWHAPTLEPLDVVGSVTVYGLVVEDRLKVDSLAADGLIPIDTTALSQALPPVLLDGGPGAPPLRAVAAWYAPQGRFSIEANYRKPQAEMAAMTSLLLVVGDKGQEVLGGLSLLPRVEKRFAFDLAVPAGWQVASVTTADGRPLEFSGPLPLRENIAQGPLSLRERVRVRAGNADNAKVAPAAAQRVHVSVPAGIPVGREFKVHFHAVLASQDWLAEWSSRRVEFPHFAVLDATHDEGAVAVDVRDDMTVRPEQVVQLTPLDAAEKPKYGLADAPTVLAYRYEQPEYAASLVVERTKPRLSARTFSFFRIEPDALNCHYELVYSIEEARTQRLALLLPKETPAAVSIVALDGVKLKEFGAELAGEHRRWNVLLAEPQRGRVRLAVDFQQPLPSPRTDEGTSGGLSQFSSGENRTVPLGSATVIDLPVRKPPGLSLPVVLADNAAYQSGLTAVEGCAELDVRVDTPARRVDVGELAEADYQPGRRLLGAFGFAGDPPSLKIDVERHPGYGICPTIVEQCRLDTNLSAEGKSQTQARFRLRTKAVYLEVKLPPGAEFWSAKLDGSPLKPQRRDDCVLVDVPAGSGDAAQTLQIVYASPTEPIVFRGTVDVLAPKLLLRRQRDASPTEIPLADLVWRLHVPSGYQVVRTGGTVAGEPIERPWPAIAQVAGVSYGLTGGLTCRPPFLAILDFKRCARSSAAKDSEPCAEIADAVRSHRLLASSSVATDVSHRSFPTKPQSAMEKRIEDALNSQTQLDFVDTPLTDIVDFLKDYHKIPIEFNRNALSEVGIGTDSPVTKTMKNVSLRSALRGMLKELDLTYVVQNETLTITTPEDADNQTEVRTYPVADLVIARDESGQEVAEFDSLIDLLSSTVKPQTWDSAGGVGSIVPFETGLSIVVSQTQEVHEEIEATLEQMRRAMQATGGRRIVLSKAERTAGKGNPAMGGMAGGLGGGAGGRRGTPHDKTDGVKKQADLDSLIDLITSDAKPKTWDESKKKGSKKTAETSVTDDPFASEEPNAERSKDEKGFQEVLQSVDRSAIPFSGKASQFGYARGQKKLDGHRASRGSLTGTRSLRIDVAQSPADAENVLTFRSLGAEPRLAVTLVDRSRLVGLGWGLALVVALAGAAITRRRARTKAFYVLTVGLLASLLPLLVDSLEAADVCDMLVFAAAWLVPYYLLVGAVRWFATVCGRCRTRCAARLGRASATTTVAVIVAIVSLSSFANPVLAAEPSAKPQPAASPYVIQVVEPSAPVNVPNDAIILPYDPEWKNGIKDADRLLAPYDKYVELWNRAHPDQKIGDRAIPAPYALAGATYQATLDDGEFLQAAGRIEIDVFSDTFVQIPLRLGGGVLVAAELDGKPARLSAPVVNALPADAKPPADSQPADRSLLILHVTGKGRHKLELSVRLKLERQGGWRLADGILPAAPATALTIRVPKPQTEVWLDRVSDRRAYETDKPDASIVTALSANGELRIQWRPKLAEGQVDRSLTAASSALFDVQEDGLRLTWRLDLKFRRGQRERFEVALPAGFLLEKVEGNNVRGWEIRAKTDKTQTVEIALLQAAKDRERLTLHLWRAGAVGRNDLAEFNVPLAAVPDAVLHNGQLTIRRSPLLELRTVSRSGATRIDLPTDAAQSTGGEQSPLGIRPFEAYSFAAVPFEVRIAAAPVAVKMTASVQTVLRVAQYERSLESRVAFDVQDRPVYRLRMRLPDDMQVEDVSAPGEFQYAITREGDQPVHAADQDVGTAATPDGHRASRTPGRSLLTVYLARGQQGNVPVIVRGKLGREGELMELPLPRLEALDVERQQGDVAVQVDPAFDVDAVELKNCERVLLGHLHAWLNPEQRRVARLGLHYTHGDHAAKLRLVPRQADVVCDTITNVRVTDRAIEETILLDFTIRNAGVREIAFLLPRRMAGCRISVPMLRQKTIEPVGPASGDPLRVRIELQDEVMDQLRILVENDRLLTSGLQEAPIPTVEVGRTGRRYVAIESAGRDPVKVDDDKLREMDALGRQQKEWETLGGILGREMTLAYLVAVDAQQPRLAFHTEQRAAVETVGAGIGLAETTLVLDANGAYRARLVLRVDNSTEQFLEIELPKDARLWTAYVAGEPVKPTVKPQPAENAAGTSGPLGVRIPLIKTASGELHYDVVLKYGGRMPPLGAFDQVAFPLVRCQNIRPELSQVRLYLPERYEWFDFGGTMRRVESEADLQAGYVSFQTKQLSQVMSALRQGDKWTKIRAAANLKTQQRQMDEYRATIGDDLSNAGLRGELDRNESIAQQAKQEAAQLEQTPAQTTQSLDNRQQLAFRFQDQKAARAKNVVNDLGANWKAPAERKAINGAAGFDVASKANVGFGGMQSGQNRDSGREYEQAQQPSAAQVVQGVPSLGASSIRGFQTVGRSYNEPPNRRAAPNQPRGECDSQERYKERLERQASQPSPSLQFGVGVNSDSGLAGPVMQQKPRTVPFARKVPSKSSAKCDAVGMQTPPAFAPPAAQPADMPNKAAPEAGVAAAEPTVPPAPAGLASLDFELPTRGQLYRFTIPRGEAEITARAFSGDLLRRIAAVIGVLIVGAVVWFVVGRVRRTHFAWLATRSGSTLLICLGLLSLCGGLLPIVGLTVVVVGCVLKIQRRRGQSQASRPA